jgi:uncharacterized membrane protein
MPTPSDRTSRFGIKRAFLRGLAVLLPSVLTLWILVAAYQFIDRNVAEPINATARAALVWTSSLELRPLRPLFDRFDPSDDAVDGLLAVRTAASRTSPSREAIAWELRSREVANWWAERWYADLFGLVVALIAVAVAGRLLGGWLGRKLFAIVERGFGRVPLIRQLYPSVKQIVGFFVSEPAGDGEEQKMKFSRVVLVEFPRPGVWAIGLMTGTAMKAIENEAGEALTVFVPSSPTPFTGWTVSVRREDVHELPITIDEALRYLVSGGVLVPPHQQGPHRDPLPPTERRLADHAAPARTNAPVEGG